MLEFILTMTIVFQPTNAMLGTGFTTTIHEEMHRRLDSLEACDSMAGLRAAHHYSQYHRFSTDGVKISHTCVPAVKETEL